MDKDDAPLDEVASEAEASLISKYESRIKAPTDIQTVLDTFQDTRQYVARDAMMVDEDDAVATNYVLRNQHASVSRLAPIDPMPRIELRPWLKEQAMGEDTAGNFPQDTLRFARTMQHVLAYQQEQSKLPPIIEGMMQDAMTLPVAWLKARFQEDFTKDPTGYGRNNDQADLLARYKRLSMDFKDDVFNEDDARYQELKNISRTLKERVLQGMNMRAEEARMVVTDEEGSTVYKEDSMEPEMIRDEALESRIQQLVENPEALVDVTDLPEVGYYLGPTFQQVNPEDIRWDWNIRRIEDLCYCRWMAHRVFMTGDDIREKWGIPEDKLMHAVRFDSSGHQRAGADSDGDDPENGGKEDDERNRSANDSTGSVGVRGGKYAVWEYWDRVKGTVETWVQGTKQFLASDEPEANWSGFFPFFYLNFNRVTGDILGPSDTDLTAPLQDEINRLRTWRSEAQKSAHPRWMAQRGLLRPSERQRFEEALPYSLIEVERADDLSKSIRDIVPHTYNPALYDTMEPATEMQQMIGLSGAALGAGNPNLTATAEAIGNQSAQMQTDFRLKAVMRLYKYIYQYMAEMNAQVMPLENVQAIVGPGAEWPQLSRQTILSRFIIKIRSVPNDAEERKAALDAWVTVTQIITQLEQSTTLEPITVAARMLEEMGVQDNLDDYLNQQALMQRMGMGMPDQEAPMAQPGATPETDPNAQGDMGAAGGAPAGEGFGAPPPIDSLPGPV